MTKKCKPFSTDAFTDGYRARVFGGRKVSSAGSRITILDKCQSPYSYLNDRQKADWYDGIEYADKEKKWLKKENPYHGYKRGDNVNYTEYVEALQKYGEITLRGDGIIQGFRQCMAKTNIKITQKKIGNNLFKITKRKE
ncbi:MAG: hypothetical protein R3Y47_00015 [Lachnospiraceae bacterium]